ASYFPTELLDLLKGSEFELHSGVDTSVPFPDKHWDFWQQQDAYRHYNEIDAATVAVTVNVLRALSASGVSRATVADLGGGDGRFLRKLRNDVFGWYAMGDYELPFVDYFLLERNAKLVAEARDRLGL